jgi:uncharacterized protein
MPHKVGKVAVAVNENQLLLGRTPRGQLGVAMMYNFGKSVKQDHVEAMKWLQKAADQGDADAQFFVGLAFSKGEGVKQDHLEAVKWLRKAADQGKANAQLFLGLMYYHGEGVLRDYAEAAEWLRKAADQGNADAQYNLGRMYYTGEGVTSDYIQAFVWFSLSAADSKGLSQKDAIIGRDFIAEKMWPQQMAEAKRLAREWKPQKTMRQS